MYEEGNETIFVLKQYEEIVFQNHYHAYLVTQTGETVKITQKNLPRFSPCFFIKI